MAVPIVIPIANTSELEWVFDAASNSWAKKPRAIRAAVIPLDSSDGQLRFDRATAAPTSADALQRHRTLMSYFGRQSGRTMCGVCSAAIALNAVLQPAAPFTERTIFAADSTAAEVAARCGTTLKQLQSLILNAVSTIDCTIHYASSDEPNYREFESAVSTVAGTAADTSAEVSGDAVILVNYDMSKLESVNTTSAVGSGHISPLSCVIDSTTAPPQVHVLVLDVWSGIPVWVSLRALWAAMNPSANDAWKARPGDDPTETVIARGYLIVRRNGRQRRSAALILEWLPDLTIAVAQIIAAYT